MLKFLKNIFNGFALGTAEIIPGVSGGTVALILGCYDELLSSISQFRKQPGKSLLFLIPLLLGMAAALVLLSSAVGYLLEHYPLPVMLFFIGLICGIIPILFSRIREKGFILNIRLRMIVLILLPVAFLVTMSFIRIDAGIGTDHADTVQNMSFPLMIFIFVAGILASAALVMPGVSGSFVLLTLGLYPLVIYSVSSVSSLLADITNTALLWNIGKVLLPFGAGIVIGGLSMVRLMEWLLRKYRKAVYAAVLGLLIGSVYAILSGPAVFQSETTAPVIVIGVLTFITGAALSFVLGKKKL